ncbi:MAG: TetR/AcrR family transcriptional regulator [Spirochaetales bacterium]|uniref:TetR/AcrR family transcriptional regulator n=1 Tax=Candidatus Thalassospirochaeta sargassi TaxID=3119039 RepID=A0AAJ1MKZ7_9SPIO|nr:TetR/AcrR family transcriptional regulator [Spirochaetales bacterium]
MKSTFDNLAEYKKQRVINACIQEFGEHGYDTSSMDGIIKRAGISKGGLYGYVSSKKELFLFIVDHAYSKLYEYLKIRVNSETVELQPDLLERLRDVAERAIDFYLEHPDFIYLIVRTSHIPDEGLATEVRGIFDKHFIGLFGDTDDSSLRYPKGRVLELAMWLLQKTRLDFLNEIERETNPAKIKSDFMENWDFYLGVMRDGIYGTP